MRIEENDAIISERIAEARKNAGITQKELAERLGTSTQSIKNWENNRNLPQKAVIMRISEICNADYSWIMNINAVEEVERENLLRSFTTDELLAEIKRRTEAS